MQNKTLIRLLWISTLIALSIVIIPYICNFGILNISSSPERWGPFGDYIGGLLNPIIGILNLIVLTYLSINLVKEDTERNKWTLQELARPYGNFNFINSHGELEISLCNYGLGPMIIDKFEIHDSKTGEVYKSFKDILLLYPETTVVKPIAKTFSIANERSAINKEGEITLLKISNSNNLNLILYQNYINFISQKLNNFVIHIAYSDLYKRQIELLEEQTHF